MVTWYVSANRDDEMFDDPYRFDVTRKPNDHVTFGPGGPHFCLGAHLARLETKILFQELLPRLDSIELTGPVERIRSNFVNGIKRMPVRVRRSTGSSGYQAVSRPARVGIDGPAGSNGAWPPDSCCSGSGASHATASSALNLGNSSSIFVRPAVVSRQSTMRRPVVLSAGHEAPPLERCASRRSPWAG